MNLLRRSNRDAAAADNPVSSPMKRQNHSNRDDSSVADTAELSAESAERNNSSFFCRKSKDHIGDDVDMAEESGEASSVGSSSMARQRHNKTIHNHNGGENNVELLDLKAPAPIEPNQFTKEEYEEIIEEYENEIVRLEKLNATLSANVAALYAENAAAEEELCHHSSETNASARPSLCNKQTSMEMSPDEEYAPRENDILLAEDHYLHEIAKHQKSNNKLKKQLDTQKKLVSKLSLHLKTSADKITALNKEMDEWKTNAEKNALSIHTEKAQDDLTEDVHKYQIQVIQNELISLQNLMAKNAKANRMNRQQLLEEYCNEDALWTSKLEQPLATMHRIVQSVTGGINGGIIDVPVEEHLETKPVSSIEKRESLETSGFNVMDSVVSLFGQNKNEQSCAKVEIDAHPLSTDIKTFDVSRLKKTVVAAEECRSKLEQQDVVAEVLIKSNVDEDISPDREEQVIKEEEDDDELLSNKETWATAASDGNQVEADPRKGKDAEPVLEDECEHVDDSIIDDNAEDTEIVSHQAGIDENGTKAAAVFDEETVVQAKSDEDRPGKESNVEITNPAAPNYQMHEDDGDDDDESSDEESMYDDCKGKYVAREGKDGVEHSNDRKSDNEDGKAGLTGPDKANVDEVSADAMQPQSSSFKVDNDSGRNIDDGEPAAVTISEDVPAVAKRINTGKEDMPSSTEAKKVCDELNDKPVITNEDKQTTDDKKEGSKSISHNENVISQFTLGDSSVSKNSNDLKNSKKSFSRKQLFQRESLSCSDLVVNAVDDVFHSQGERKVLVDSKSGRDSVPPYNAPSLPTETKKDAPHYKRGAKDGYYIYISSSGNEYSGHWKSGRRHGYGMAKYRDGEVFHGGWRRGRRHGHGVLHLANKDVFDGDWDTNQKHGLGVYYWADGEVDISWYENDNRLESIRWNKDRRLAYLLDLKGSKKEQISLNKAAKIVRGWERKAEVFDC